MKRQAINYLGLLGLLSLISYTAAVIFAPLAYPGYDRLAQAVSDLSADSAPSRTLWNQLSCLYMPCGIVSCTLCALAAGRSERLVKHGVRLFTLMNWVSAVGYAAFPLSDAGTPDGFQSIMHLVVTAVVVILSVVSLLLLIIGGLRKKPRSLGICAAAALFMMLFGAVGTGVFPPEYFGIPERFSVFAATGFTAALGIHLFAGYFDADSSEKKN